VAAGAGSGVAPLDGGGGKDHDSSNTKKATAMNTATTKGLRHFSRIPFAAGASLVVAGQLHNVHLIDIALKGALVQTAAARTLALHAPCTLTLPLADNGEGVVMEGRIAHLNDDHVGVAWQNIDITSLTHLRRLLELNLGDAQLLDRELSHLFG